MAEKKTNKGKRMVTKPSFKPNEQQRQMVEQYSATGTTQENISLVLGIDVKTLRKHFRVELDTAAIKANANVGGKLYNKAMAGDTTAAIWWSKSRMGWKEKSEVEHSGKVVNVITGVPSGDD